MHNVTPGDVLFCNCCQKKISIVININYSVTSQNTMYFLREKTREGITTGTVTLEIYAWPGSLVFYNATLAIAMMQKLPISILNRQGNKWNIFLPLDTGNTCLWYLLLANCKGKYFIDYFFDDVMERFSGFDKYMRVKS